LSPTCLLQKGSLESKLDSSDKTVNTPDFAARLLQRAAEAQDADEGCDDSAARHRCLGDGDLALIKKQRSRLQMNCLSAVIR
jgi:hypothetical protein